MELKALPHTLASTSAVSVTTTVCSSTASQAAMLVCVLLAASRVRRAVYAVNLTVALSFCFRFGELPKSFLCFTLTK